MKSGATSSAVRYILLISVVREALYRQHRPLSIHLQPQRISGARPVELKQHNPPPFTRVNVADSQNPPPFPSSSEFSIHSDLEHEYSINRSLSRASMIIGGLSLYFSIFLPPAEYTLPCEIVTCLCFAGFVIFCITLSRITQISKVVHMSSPIAITALVNWTVLANFRTGSPSSGVVELISDDLRFGGTKLTVRFIRKRTDSPLSSNGEYVPAQLYCKPGTERPVLIETAELFCLV